MDKLRVRVIRLPTEGAATKAFLCVSAMRDNIIIAHFIQSVRRVSHIRVSVVTWLIGVFTLLTKET